MRFRTWLVYLVTAIALFAVLLPLSAAGSLQIAPDLEQQCLAAPQTTALQQSGIPAATIGETVSWTQLVEIDGGDVYQDILSDPGGEVFYASYLEITQLYDTDPGDFLSLVAPPTFAIDGNPVATIPGTAPDPVDFVLDTLVSPSGASIWRVYFPGDVATMLADQPGEGQFSYTVPAGGQTFSLSFDTVVQDDPAVVAGVVLDGASCYAQISSGPSNRNTDRPIAAVSIVEPVLILEKASQAPANIVAPGGIVTYEITATNPEFNATGTLTSSTAYSVVLVDTLAAGATPVDAAGVPLADGASTPSGGVYDATANTLTWDPVGDIAPGTEVVVEYDVLIDSSLAGGAVLPNEVVADLWSLPGETGRPYDDAADADAEVTVGGSNPALDKSLTWVATPGADPTTITDPAIIAGPIPIGFEFEQTVTVELSPNSVQYNTTVQDIIPDGLEFIAFTSSTCEVGAAGPGSCPSPAGQTLTPPELPGGTTPLLWYIGDVTTGADPQIYTFTYTLRLKPEYAATDAALQLEDILTNSVDLYWNLVDRLGDGVEPSPGSLPGGWDGQLDDTTSVEFGRPVLTIEKTDLVDPEPADLADQGGPISWEITVTNTGNLPAENIDIADSPSLDLASITIASSTDTVNATATGFEIPGPIPPGGSVTFVLETDVLGQELSTQVSINEVDVSCYRDAFDPDATSTDDRPCYDDVDSSGDSVSYLYPEVVIDKTLIDTDPPQVQDNPFSAGYGGPVWFRIDLENRGDGTAWNVELTDIAPPGFCASDLGFLELDGVTPITTLAFTTSSASPFGITGVENLEPTDAAPGGADEFSFLYAITPCGPVEEGPQNLNEMGVTYEDALGNEVLDGDPYVDDDTATFGVAAPTLAIEKTGDVTDVFFDQDMTDADFNIVTWTIVVENTSPTQWVYSATVDDVVPAGLLADFGDVHPSVPQITADAPITDNSTSGTDISIDIPSIPPGGSVTITIPTYQDGTIPAADADGSYQLVNTAEVTSPNTPCDPTLVCEDDAAVTLSVPWNPPDLQKTVADADEPVDGTDDPDSSAGGVAGETSLEYTLTVTVPDNDPEGTLDVWVQDIIPHGIQIDPASVAISCTGAGCDPATSYLGLISTAPNLYEEHAFWLGDVGVGGATYTIVYNAEALTTFADGTPVLGGATYTYDLDGEEIEQLAATPFVNRAELFWNAPALIGGSGDVLNSDPYAEDGDGDPTTASAMDDSREDSATYDIIVPLLVIEKVAERYRPDPDDLFSAPIGGTPVDFGVGFTNDSLPANQVYDADDSQWPASDVGDWFRYTIEVPNLGTSAAYNIVFNDDLTLDGAMVPDPGSITTAIGPSSDPNDPALATLELAAAAATTATGICSYDDAGTAGITRALVADDVIDCFDNSGLAPGESIFLTYWAQTQTSDELVSSGVAGPGVPGSASPDRILNTTTLVSYNATPAAGGDVISGDDDFHEQVVFTPIAEINYAPESGACAGLNGEVTEDGTIYDMRVTVDNGFHRYENGDTPVWSTGLGEVRAGPSGIYPPEGFGIGYDQVITVTLPVGIEYVVGSGEWFDDPIAGGSTTVPLPDPIITGSVATGQTLVWDANDPNMAGIIPDEVDPNLYSNGFWSTASQIGSPVNRQILNFDVLTPNGTNWGQSWGSANITYEDQLGSLTRSNSAYEYTVTDPEGCGGEPGSSFSKTPDLPWINPSTGENYEQAVLDSDTEFEFFFLNLTLYSDGNDYWFVDYLPPQFTYAGDPTNAATYLTDPQTNIPASMFGGGGVSFVNDMQTVVPNSPNPGETTIYYGPFNLDADGGNVNSNGGSTFQIKVPVRRTLPYDEDTSPGVYTNNSAVLSGPDIDNLDPTGFGNEGEMEIPPPSPDPIVDKRITNWQNCTDDPARACGLYGDTAQFEIVVQLPKFFTGDDVVVGDIFHALNSTTEPDWGPATNISIECNESTVGGPVCDSNDDGAADFDFTVAAAQPLAPGMILPTNPGGTTPIDDTGNDGAFGWYLGDVEAAADGNDRYLVITYDLPAPAWDAANPPNLLDENTVLLRYDDVNNGVWSEYWDGYDPALDQGPNGFYPTSSDSYLQDWTTSLDFDHAGSFSDSDEVDYWVGYPIISVAKKCESLTPVATEWLDSNSTPTIQATAPGVPNVRCEITVDNNTRWDALNVIVNENDDNNDDRFINDPAQSDVLTFGDLVWEVTGITAGGSLTTAPIAGATTGDLQDFAWTIDKLEPDETVAIVFEARIDFPDQPDPADPEGTMWWQVSNETEVSGWTDNPDQYPANLDRPDPQPMGLVYTRSDTVDATRPRVLVTKFPVEVAEQVPTRAGLLDLPADANAFDVGALLINCDRGDWFTGPYPAGSASSQDAQSCWYPGGIEWYENDAYDFQLVPSSTVEWALGFEIHFAEVMDEVRLTDSLPFGMTYKPGSAVLWDMVNGGSTPLSDPAITAASNDCNASDDHALGGDTLQWDFSPTSPDPLLAAAFATDEATAEAAGYDSFVLTRGVFGVISFEVDVADYDTLMSCYDADNGEWDWFENRTDIEGDHTAGLEYEDHYDLVDDSFVQLPFRDGLTMKKLPDDALEISGTTPEFVIEIENNTDDLTYTDLTITDTLDMTSDALNEWLDGTSCTGVDPALCAWVEVISTGQPGYSPTLVEDSFTWLSGPPSGTAEIVWSIATLPPQTTIRIHIPIASDKDTPTGTEWLNEVTIDSPEMFEPLSDVGDITFVAPSPPPPLVKSGLELGTIGTQWEASIDVVLGANEAWLDLALVVGGHRDVPAARCCGGNHLDWLVVR